MSVWNNLFVETPVEKVNVTVEPGIFRCEGDDKGLRVEVVGKWRQDGEGIVSLRIGSDGHPTIGVNKHTANVLSGFFLNLARAL